MTCPQCNGSGVLELWASRTQGGTGAYYRLACPCKLRELEGQVKAAEDMIQFLDGGGHR